MTAPTYVVQFLDFESETERLSTGHEVPAAFTVLCVRNPLPPDSDLLDTAVEISVVVQSGKALVTRIVVNGTAENPIGSGALRDFKLQEIVEQVVAGAASFTALKRIDRDAVRPATRRRRLDDALLRRVAEIVRQNPDARTRAVQMQAFTSHRNATRWIAAARDRGFLSEEAK